MTPFFVKGLIEKKIKK